MTRARVDHAISGDELRTPSIRLSIGKHTHVMTINHARELATALNTNASHAELGAAMIAQVEARGIAPKEARTILSDVHNRLEKRKNARN